MWQGIWFWEFWASFAELKQNNFKTSKTTELHKLQPEELKSMPTNNIICEHLLATFSHHADVSKFRNRKFSAKEIKGNIVLHQANQSTMLAITKTIQKLLSVGRPIYNIKRVSIVFSEQTRYCWKENLWQENLLVLLGDDNCLVTSSHASVLDLRTNNDLSKFLDCVTEDTIKFFS